MRKITLALAALAAMALAGPAFAGDADLKGGATLVDGAVQLVSDTSDATTTNDASWIEFSGVGVNKFSQLKTLSTEYNVTDDGCAGGSPRFQIAFGDKNVFVYLGPLPSFNTCELNTWLASGNLVGGEDRRWDLSQLGGAQYSTYAEALALLGDRDVTGISLVVDSGWAFADKEQTVLVRNVMVNGTQQVGPRAMNPAQTCKALRTSMGADRFRDTYGTNRTKANAFGKCVSSVARAERAEGVALAAGQAELKRAARTCVRQEGAVERKGKGKAKGHARANAVRAAALSRCMVRLASR